MMEDLHLKVSSNIIHGVLRWVVEPDLHSSVASHTDERQENVDFGLRGPKSAKVGIFLIGSQLVDVGAIVHLAGEGFVVGREENELIGLFVPVGAVVEEADWGLHLGGHVAGFEVPVGAVFLVVPVWLC